MNSSHPQIIAPFAKAEQHWTRWVFQTAQDWSDIVDIIRMTDVDAVDQDHRKLTEITLELNDLLSETDGKQSFDLKKIAAQSAVLENLYTFSKHHFQREEHLIQQFNLPSLDMQKRQHAKFLDMVLNALDDFSQGRLTISLTLKSSILEWWISHINDVDYYTFNKGNLAAGIIGSTNSWETLQEIIKPMHIQSLDYDHQQLAKKILGLVDIVQHHEVMEENLFLDLYRSIKEHFDHEEEFIAKHNLPGLDFHHDQHAQFLESLSAFVEDWEDGIHEVSPESLRAILSWWITHINEIDAPFFSSELLSATIFTAANDWHDFETFILPVGIERIDEDHKKITTVLLRIDQLAIVDAASSEMALNQWLAFFDDLYAMVNHHFIKEQSLMETHHLSLRQIHIDEHDKFLKILRNYRDDVKHGRLIVSSILKQHILDWWVNHINQLDIPTFSHLAALG